MIVVNRRELKFAISEWDYHQLQTQLSELLTPDPHNGVEGYTIRSVYFDSLFSADYYAKMDGEEERKKIRLRIYHPDDQEVKLEIKRKMNISQRKETVTISREDAKSLINCDYSVLLNYDNPVAQTAYNIMTVEQYVPKVMVDYRRKAFIHQENKIRVTLDSDIRSNEFDFNLFSKEVYCTPVYDHWHALLEIKYDGDFFQWISGALVTHDSVYQSLSKYCVGRKFFDNYLS